MSGRKEMQLYNAVLSGHVEAVREILSTLKDTPEDINELKKVLISATKEIKKCRGIQERIQKKIRLLQDKVDEWLNIPPIQGDDGWEAWAEEQSAALEEQIRLLREVLGEEEGVIL